MAQRKAGKQSAAQLREVLSKWDKKGGLAPLTSAQQVINTAYHTVQRYIAVLRIIRFFFPIGLLTFISSLPKCYG